MTEYVFSEEELAEINRIKDTKFGTWDWNYGKSPEFNVRRGTKFTSGKVEILPMSSNQKSKTSRFMVTSLVLKTLQL